MPIASAIQLVCIALLVALGAMLAFVGAFGSAALCGVVGCGWFVWLYRRIEE